MTAKRSLLLGHFRRGTTVKPRGRGVVAAQRLNRLAQLLDRSAVAPVWTFFQAVFGNLTGGDARPTL